MCCFVEGFAGCKLWAPRVLLVATQSDDGGGVESDPEGLSAELRQRYEADLVIEPHVFVVDSVNTSGSEMTALKRSLASIKHLICQVCTFISCTLHHHTTPQPFYGPSSGTTRVSWCKKSYTKLDFDEARDDRVAVASSGLYTNHLHLTAET